ncbi:MAG: beta-propeller fold lactonase family protein [Ruminiclostridium sp.]|nr:beta-propeller fold lactonase family protein [Ruminiclostridium sp.]
MTNKIYVANYSSNNVTVIDGATNSTTIVAAGAEPRAVAVNPSTNKIYVANNYSDNVTVIDGATDSATATVAAGNIPWAVAVNPATNKIYVANFDGNVTVIDGATNSVTATVTAGVCPAAIAVNPSTNKIYVANNYSDNVTVIDGATDSVTATVAAGRHPYAVAVNPSTNKIYVANEYSNNITVIDGATNNTATVTAGTTPIAVAVNPSTNKIYVANYSSNNVTVIDGATNNTATVTAGINPIAVAVNTATNKIYVANQDYDSVAGSVTVIDGATDSATTVAAGSRPLAVAVNPVTNKIYVANHGSHNVTVIDGATNITTTVATGRIPKAVAVNPSTNKIYVVNSLSDNVTVIDGATDSVTATVTTGAVPNAVAVNPATNKIYVVNSFDDNVTVIDGATDSVTAAVAAGEFPIAVAVNPSTNKIYVINWVSNNVTVIDGATNSVTATVTAGVCPAAIAVNPSTNKIYVANVESDSVTVIDGATNNTATVTAGTNPIAVAVNPSTNKIYVTNDCSNSVTVIDGATDSATTVAAGSNPLAVAVNPSTNKIYVANGSSNNVTVIDGVTNNTATVTVGTFPRSIAVNPSTNKIYVANNNSNNVTVIDGATDSATATVTAGAYPDVVAVNPSTNKIYVVNKDHYGVTGSVTVIDEQSEQDASPAAMIMPLLGNITSDTTPAFEFNAPSESPLPVRQIWYQTDTLNGQWQKAVPEGSSACATISALSLGTHILYAMATDGQDASSVNTGTGSSPMIGKTVAYAFTVISPPEITASELPDGMLQRSYSSTLSALYGIEPYTWNSSGLPGGMYLNTVTGEVYGYPEMAGSFNPSFTVTDILGTSSSRSVSLTISSAPDGSGCLSAAPATATAGGTVNSIDFTYAPSEGGMYDGTVTIEVPGGWTMPSTVPGSPGYVTADRGDVTVSGQTITVTGVGFHEGDGLEVTYSNASAPAAGIYSFNAKAKTTVGGTLTNLAPNSLPSITLGADATAPVWSLDSTLSITNKTVNGFTLNWPAATDNIAMDSYRIYSDGSLISTVAASAYSYSVAGLAPGESHTYQVKAVDLAGNIADGPGLAVDSSTAMTVGIGRILEGVVGEAYSITLSANGGEPPYTFSASGFPTGFSINSSTGVISGTPSAQGLCTVTAAVYDGLEQQIHITFDINIEAPIVPDTTAPAWPNGTALTVSDRSLNALTLNWSQATDDTGVSGYRIYRDSSLVSEVAGSVYRCGVAGLTPGVSYTFGVKAFDAAGNTSSELTLTASTNSVLTINTGGITTATAGSPYSASLVAGGGTAPYTWGAAGLPAGFSLDASTGTLTGTPAAAGTWMVNVTLSDSLGNITSKGFTLSVFYLAGTGKYTVSPSSDTAYTAGATTEGITTLTVNNGVTGFKYFTVNITTVQSHTGNEVAVFVQMRSGVQIAINATKADFDRENSAMAAFNVRPGDIIKVYIVDDLTNDVGFNPTLLQ